MRASTIVVVAFALVTGCAGGREQADPRTDEVARIRAHLAAVETELRAADVSDLTAEQRAARDVHLDRLHAYAAAGVFPHNHGAPGRVPFFVDRHGTRCAMAHLIEHAGGAALVAEVAAQRNNATVHELADEPALIAWLDRNGLSVDEAARIQPSYDPCSETWYDPEECEEEDVPKEFAVASLAATGLSGAAIALNLDADAKKRDAYFGIIAGALTAALGYTAVDEDEDPDHVTKRTIGYVDIGVGVVAAILGVRTLVRAPWKTKSPAAPPAPSGPPGWSLSPTLGASTGVSLHRAF